MNSLSIRYSKILKISLLSSSIPFIIEVIVALFVFFNIISQPSTDIIRICEGWLLNIAFFLSIIFIDLFRHLGRKIKC